MVYYAGNLRFHLAALEDELRKIQVFHRELPLCYEVVTQTIEEWKQKLFEKDAVMECDLALSEDQNSLDRPVLEEFTPLGGDDDQEERKGVHWHEKSDDNREEKKKSEWLRSLQLWNPIPDLNSQEGEYDDDDDDDSPPVIPEKTPRSEANAIDTNTTWSLHWEPSRGNHKASGKLSSSPADSSTSGNGEGRMTSKGKEKQQARNSQRKQRRCWWPELHHRFLSALEDLGGPQVATPKQIKELMKVNGLTNDEIKSHLQKYRLHTRRSPPPQNDSPIQAQQLVVVGGIWVPQPDFPVVAGSVSLPQPNKIYAPAGTIPMKHSANVEPKTAPAASSSSRTITDP